jgi:hypothetical protein
VILTAGHDVDQCDPDGVAAAILGVAGAAGQG